MQRSVWLSKSIITNPEVKYTSVWHLDFLQDEKRFARYYDLFAITKSKPSSPSLWEEYNRFLIWATNSIKIDTIMFRNKIAKKPEKPAKATVPLTKEAEQAQAIPSVEGAAPIHSDINTALPPAALDILAAAAAE